MKVQGRNAEGSSAWASPSAASLFRSYRSIWSSPPKEGESGGAQEVADDEDTQTGALGSGKLLDQETVCWDGRSSELETGSPGPEEQFSLVTEGK